MHAVTLWKLCVRAFWVGFRVSDKENELPHCLLHVTHPLNKLRRRRTNNGEEVDSCLVCRGALDPTVLAVKYPVFTERNINSFAVMNSQFIVDERFRKLCWLCREITHYSIYEKLALNTLSWITYGPDVGLRLVRVGSVSYMIDAI